MYVRICFYFRYTYIYIYIDTCIYIFWGVFFNFVYIYIRKPKGISDSIDIYLLKRPRWHDLNVMNEPRGHEAWKPSYHRMGAHPGTS